MLAPYHEGLFGTREPTFFEITAPQGLMIKTFLMYAIFQRLLLVRVLCRLCRRKTSRISTHSVCRVRT